MSEDTESVDETGDASALSDDEIEAEILSVASEGADFATPEAIALEPVVAYLERRARDEQRRYRGLVSQPDYVADLAARLSALTAAPEEFSTGELVTWKAGLKNRRFPADGAPAIVVESAPGAVDPNTDVMSPNFGQPVDLVLGVILGNGQFATFRYDSRRFAPWQDERSTLASENDPPAAADHSD